MPLRQLRLGQRVNRLPHLQPTTKGHAGVLRGLIGQITKDGKVDIVIGKGLSVLGHPELLETSPQFVAMRAAPTLCCFRVRVNLSDSSGLHDLVFGVVQRTTMTCRFAQPQPNHCRLEIPSVQRPHVDGWMRRPLRSVVPFQLRPIRLAAFTDPPFNVPTNAIRR
jgi:hypothetical protein